MSKTYERWQNKTGRPNEDNRDWRAYNEELVRHGEFLLDYDWITKGWYEELEEMNNGKKGAPFQFPNSLIGLQAVWHQLVDYREVEGITRKVAEKAQIPAFNDFSTINRRVNKLNIEFELPKQGFVSVSTDGTGIKLNNAGEYRYDKYGKKKQKKYIKVTISANPLTKEMLDCDVSIEGDGLSEHEVSKKHMQRQIGNGKEIDKFWGDGGFDVLELFNFLEENNIEAAIKIRDNASEESRGSMRRAREVREYKAKGYSAWSRDKQYGKRWLGTEVQISAVKVKFGERVRAKKTENMLKEAKRKFWAYAKIKAYGLA
ncbi:MAG: IS5 family transposase [Nanoarchaeota archaeon]|nr:IS5 family transposase [Nanoarchaeota archaeon]